MNEIITINLQKENFEIRKVLKRSDNIKMAIIPKKSNILAGDYVMLIKINEKEVLEDARRKKEGS